MLDIIPYREINTKRRRLRVAFRRKHIRLMARLWVPGAGEIIRHHVPEIEVPVHFAELQPLEVRGSRGGGDGEEEMWVLRERVGVLLQFLPHGLE